MESLIAFMLGSQDRKEKRVQVARPAWVSGPDGEPRIRCVVRDASPSGCKISSDAILDLPDDVLIHPDGMSQPLRGRIVWRKDNFVGIKFNFSEPQSPKDTQ